MKIKILANPSKDWALALAPVLRDFLLENGHEVTDSGADATICIGGDGTILYNYHKEEVEGTILGIGSEKSYICQLTHGNWKEGIIPLLSSGRTIRCMGLEAALGSDTYTAINDFVIHATHYRVAEIEVSFGNELHSFEGDGFIVSSALGSTGYAYSAGGEKRSPQERSIQAVPICPYQRSFLPHELSEDGVIEVTVGNDCAFILDGIYIRDLAPGEKVQIKRGSDMILFEGVGFNEG